MHISDRPRPPFLLLLALSLLALLVRADGPQVSTNLFANRPSKISYFEDTTVVFFHDVDAQDVYWSSNEGKSWGLVDGVPRGEARLLILHPHNNRMAFILTDSTKHYRTANRGETWQSFETPHPPAPGSDALAFNKREPEWIIYQGRVCKNVGWGGWLGKSCTGESYYTRDAFASSPSLLLRHTQKCLFSPTSSSPSTRLWCIAYSPTPDTSASSRIRSLEPRQRLADARLYASDDFFDKEKKFVDLGIGREARGVVNMGAVGRYVVLALKEPGWGEEDEMQMFVTVDGEVWHRAVVPHGHQLKENAYTILEATGHSLLVDVLSHPESDIGTLFTSNSNGTYFRESLRDTDRNSRGIVAFEELEAVQGVAIANVVRNVDDVKSGDAKRVRSLGTWDDGATWRPLKAPSRDAEGKDIGCDVSDTDKCSLHLHSVAHPHNVGRAFSSPAPGLVMGVGSVGAHLLDYEDCDTFLSTDAGLTWSMVQKEAHMHEFGDQGSVLVIVENEDYTDHVHYSYDMGKSWNKLDLHVKIRAGALTTIPDSTSQKFVLVGSLPRRDQTSDNRFAVVHLDFAPDRTDNKCGDNDFEKWWVKAPSGDACLMGHQQWFKRRKRAVTCFVGDKFNEPEGKAEQCACSEADYECDYNFVREGDKCIPARPEPIPAGACPGKSKDETFLGSSGYRKIPGNTCDPARGIRLDEPVKKPCEAGAPPAGQVSHQRFDFPAPLVQSQYFQTAHTVLVLLDDGTVWQSSNEGYTWNQLFKGEQLLALQMHDYAPDRAYVVTADKRVFYTDDAGQNWRKFEAPLEANGLGIAALDFHPTRPEWLIWTGSKDCISHMGSECHAVAYYTKDNGRSWHEIDSYVRKCTWARDKDLKVAEDLIYCESYRDKKGLQRATDGNPRQFIAGKKFYSEKIKLFDNIEDFTTFENYVVVAEIVGSLLALRVSVDGLNFATAQFPPNFQLENMAYTILESTTGSIFLHLTTHSTRGSEWGALLKSNSNGTFYSLSLEHVNRNDKGYVDFEKMLGLDGVALMNIVSNPDSASVTGKKELQTKITHNDGGTWKYIVPPARDSLGDRYSCDSTSCALHLHGYTERRDPRATFSSPSAVGLMLAVGNVGENLASYTDSDTFFTRDGGFTWQEVHKDAHLFEFGDQGSIIVLANDEEPTDHVLYSRNEGLSWETYSWGERIRVTSIQTVPLDTSRRFIVFGTRPTGADAVAIHLDFTGLTNRKCVLKLDDQNNDDFELWSPSEEREERCLFGHQALYHRRIRDADCYIGERYPQPRSIERNCLCTEHDFECEFNHYRDASGNCVLVSGATTLANNDTCSWDQNEWYERTAYRKIPHSTCEGGYRPDLGAKHACPAGRKHGFFFWGSVIVAPFLIAGLAGAWFFRKQQGTSGRIRLPDPSSYGESPVERVLATLASVPYFLIGAAGVLFSKLSEIRIPFISDRLSRRRGGYRSLPLDDDAVLVGGYED